MTIQLTEFVGPTMGMLGIIYKDLSYLRGAERHAVSWNFVKTVRKIAFEKVAVGEWPWRSVKVIGNGAIRYGIMLLPISGLYQRRLCLAPFPRYYHFCCVHDCLWPYSPVYTIQPVVKTVVKPDWQPVVSCIQTFNRLSNPFDNRFHKRRYRVYSRLSIRLYNRFDYRLYRVNGV